jgi:membrane-associated protease RseP (regulator of RpoE activity)
LNALWYYAIGFLIIWILAFAFKDKLKIDISGPILMRRTKRLRNFIDSTAQRSPRFWRGVMSLGIPMAFFFMILMVVVLLISLQSLLSSPQIGIILPGVDIPGSQIYVPFGVGIIALMTVMVVHEFGHGILARVEGVRIKSIGVLLLAVLPGAFVEPDEEDIEKSKRISKLRIYAAGSVFNLGLALVSLILFLLISVTMLGSIFMGIPGIAVPGTTIKTPNIGYNISGPIYPTFQEQGMQISSVVPGSPADGILKEGMVIQSINGIPTTNTTDYVNLQPSIQKGETLTIQTDQGTEKVTTGTNPNNATKGYIGIRSQSNLVVNQEVASKYGTILPWFFYDLSNLLYWIFLLNFAVGTFNLLPLKPLDGGLMLEELLRYRLSENIVQKIINPLSYFLIIVIVVSIVYSLGRGLLLLLF